MRVLHVTPYFAPAFRYGGPPRSMLGLCRALGDAGVDVEVFTTTANGTEPLPAAPGGTAYDGVPVRYFPLAWPKRYWRGAGLRSALMKSAAQRRPRTRSRRVEHHRMVGRGLRAGRRPALRHLAAWHAAARRHAAAPRDEVAGVLGRRARQPPVGRASACDVGPRSQRTDDVRSAGRADCQRRRAPRSLGRRRRTIARAGRSPTRRRDRHVPRPAASDQATRPPGRGICHRASGASEREARDCRTRRGRSSRAGRTVVCAGCRGDTLARRRGRRDDLGALDEQPHAGAVLRLGKLRDERRRSADRRPFQSSSPTAVAWAEIESTGCGFSVAHEPVAIADGLLRLLDQPALAAAMGARGQAWARRMFAWDSIGRAMRTHTRQRSSVRRGGSHDGGPSLDRC